MDAAQALSEGGAFEAAVDALTCKERTAAELRDLLLGRGHESAEVDGALERLEAIGELDDARFARRYAEDKRELRGWGSERIRAALLERGVSAADVEEALADIGAEEEVELAVGLLRDRGANLADPAERQRALGLLIRRGYDSEVAYEAIRRARRG